MLFSRRGVRSALQNSTRRRIHDNNVVIPGILQAHGRIYDVCKETSLDYAPTLSKMLGNEVFIKREDQQPVFSFKLRGAFNKIASLSQEERDCGIVACSAGNHAQVGDVV